MLVVVVEVPIPVYGSATTIKLTNHNKKLDSGYGAGLFALNIYYFSGT